MDVLNKLQTEWDSEYVLQPTTAAERKTVIAIQALKKEAANEIIKLREWVKYTGDMDDTCTYSILRKICDNCRCNRNKNE